jgi:nitroimidazol reductase NimA-like FMN-containing flavoprotein (pyridoxamine 5'-phosphate oxidase superfamily)
MKDMVSKEEMRARTLAFLKDTDTMVLSTVSASGAPQAATMYFVPDDDFNLYFMTSSGSAKNKNLQSNANVAFVVGTGPAVMTIQGGGKAEPLDEHEALVFYGLIEKIASKSPWKWPILRLTTGKNTFRTFRVRPAWMTMLHIGEPLDPDVPTDGFYKII